MFVSCTDDDSFSAGTGRRLAFSADTISMDTLFSTVPSSTRKFWVYNKNKDGLRISRVRLIGGNQSGFRVNVDGEYMSQFQLNNLEIRKGDSILVFVELTAPVVHSETPQLLEDDLEFTLENGTQQRVNLKAYAWDAEQITNLVVERDTLLAGNKPRIIYGGITVKEGATLSLNSTTLYFHDGAGIDVHGRLIATGTADKNVVLRGDRLDHMFDYLPYDQVSGQWKGLRFYESSTGNMLTYTDIHSAMDGIVCDSAAFSSDEDALRLALSHCTVHNNKGDGLRLFNSRVAIDECQITNSLNDCLAVYGGWVKITNSTIAQFYPFVWSDGAALHFANIYQDKVYPLYGLVCANSIITGYADDVLVGEVSNEEAALEYKFVNSILRTPKVDLEDSVKHFSNIIWESAKDSIEGKKHFKRIDLDRQAFDFHLDSLSSAINKGDVNYTHMTDRDGRTITDGKPDVGCYEYMKITKTQ